jgi:DNA-binding response OmpR family regulator
MEPCMNLLSTQLDKDAIVLLLEDDYMIAEITSDILDENGLGVVKHASNIKQAFEITSCYKIDIAILDVSLGKETGFPIADYLSLLEVPFLFMTGYQDDVLPSKYKDASFLLKPAPMASLIRELQELYIKSKNKR